jgi:hypothetical protein
LILLKLGKHYYQVLVTNLPLQPPTPWRLYNHRASVELIIRKLEHDYSLGPIASRHFFADEAYFQLGLFVQSRQVVRTPLPTPGPSACYPPDPAPSNPAIHTSLP